jgi:hypothetical protein
VARRLSNQIERLGAPGAAELQVYLPPQQEWPTLAQLTQTDAEGQPVPLLQLSAQLVGGTRALSDAIGARYFSHASDAFRAVNA